MIEGKFRIGYEQAFDIANTNGSIEVSLTGGMRRFVKFSMARGVVTHGPGTQDICEISAMLFKTQIARYCPDRVIFTTGGYNTATTRDAMNFLIGGQPIGGFHILDRRMYYRSKLMTEGQIMLGYDGMPVPDEQP